MGPWQIRLESNPFTPGVSFEKLAEMIAKGRIRRDTVIRGPSTNQFWAFACDTPGVAALLGECHACHNPVKPDEYMCGRCFAALGVSTDRQHLGLAPTQSLGAVGGRTPTTSRPEQPTAPVPLEGAIPLETPTTVELPMVRTPPVMIPPRVASTTAPHAPATPVRDRAYRNALKQIEFFKAVIVGLAVVVVGLAGLSVALAVSKRAMPTQQAVAPNAATNTTSNSTPGVDPSAVLRSTTSKPEPANHDEESMSAQPVPKLEVVKPVEPAPKPAESPESKPTLEVKPLKRDPGLDRWRSEIDRALELEAQNTIDSLTQAADALARVLADARKADPGGIFPLLESRLEDIRQKRDDLKLKGLLKD